MFDPRMILMLAAGTLLLLNGLIARGADPLPSLSSLPHSSPPLSSIGEGAGRSDSADRGTRDDADSRTPAEA